MLAVGQIEFRNAAPGNDLSDPTPLNADAKNATAGAAAARKDLLSAFEAESKRGHYIFYTQTYKLSGRNIKFHGSIFGVIEDVQAEGCKLQIESALFDRYSGNIGRKIVGLTQNKYITTVDLRLTPKMADGLKVVIARPVRQLAADTYAVCAGDRQCSLTWLKMKTDRPVIHQTDVTDDVSDYDGEVKDFDGAVSQVYWPVSSAEAGNEIISRMRTFAGSCDQ